MIYTKNSEYDQELPQSQTADNPLAPRGRAAQPSQSNKVAKIRNRYNQVPHLTQDTNGKVTNSQKTPQTRDKTPGRQLSKATSSLFSIKMIAKLKWTQSNIQQNIEQLQTPTMGVTINKKSTTTEPPP